MDFPAILDVGLGLVVVFFLLASISSILVEMFANGGRWRHRALKSAVNALLKGHEKPAAKEKVAIEGQPRDDSKRSTQKNSRGEAMEDLFWSHPEIEPLRAPDTESPAYLDGKRFARVVLDIATGKGADGVLPDSRVSFVRAFEQHASPQLRERLGSLLRNLPPDTLTVRAELTAALAGWYDEAMARSTGSYKRKVQTHLFWIGLAVASILNCDALRITYVLFRDPGLRGSMVDYAKSISAPTTAPTNATALAPAIALAANRTSTVPAEATNTNDLALAQLQASLRNQIKELQRLERIGFPIGWVSPFDANFLPFRTEDGPTGSEIGLWEVLLKLIGLLATAFAVCLGAPFWFDVLNKLLKLRTPDAKTGAENASQPSAATAVTPTPPTGPVAGAAFGASPLPPKPLRPIGEALRDPTTQFQAVKAYWLAEASLLAYAAPHEVEATVKQAWRFDRIEHFSDGPTNTQGFLAIGGGAAILAFRGTEPDQLPNWETDAQAFLIASQEFPGKIHEGFAKSLESVYERVKTALEPLPGSGALLYLTGHSLGAALATLCAHRIAAARGYPIQGVCTYGSPRVGDPTFAEQYRSTLGSRTFRVVNNEDLVTRVPPRLSGYEHVGEMVYIDDRGSLQRDIGFWYRFLNLAANAAADFKQAAKTTVRDHSMSLYCEHLKRASVAPDK